MNHLSTLLYLLFSLFMLVLVLFMAYHATRWLGKRSLFSIQNSSQNMEVLDRLYIAQDKSLLIVKVAQRRLLLAVSQQQISKVMEFADDESIVSFADSSRANFSDLFSDTIKKTALFNKRAIGQKEENQ